MHQAMATVIVAVGLAVAGWGINILLSDNSPFLPWVSPSLISGGLGLVLAGVVRLSWPLMRKRRDKNPLDEIIRRLVRELEDNIGRTGWIVGDIDQTWLDRLYVHGSYFELPQNIQDGVGTVRRRTAALMSMPRSSAIRDHSNYVREATLFRNDLATFISVVECSRAIADRIGVKKLEGIANLTMRVKADFRNKDNNRPHYMKYVEVIVNFPNGQQMHLYQVAAEILRDYRFDPGETRTEDIMEFQTHVSDRLPAQELEGLFRIGELKVYLEVCTSEGPTQHVPLEIQDLWSKMPPESAPNEEDNFTGRLTVENQVYEHGDAQSGMAYSIRIRTTGPDVHNCVGNLVDLALLDTNSGLDTQLIRFARGYLQWSGSSRISPEERITTTIRGGIPCTLDVVLHKMGGYQLDGLGRSDYLVAYAASEVRYSNAPPSSLAILLLVCIKGDDEGPVYAVCKFDPKPKTKFIRTGKFGEDGGEAVNVKLDPHFEILAVSTEEPVLADFRPLADVK